MLAKRHLLTGAAALSVAAALAVPTGPAQAQADATVRFLHGIGPDANAVDVYIDDALALTNVQFEDVELLDPLDAGVHNVKMCSADPAPPATLTDGCPIGGGGADLRSGPAPRFSVGPNTGTDIVVVAGTNVTFAAVYSPIAPIGRPTVMQVSHQVGCIDAGETRISATNQAAFVDPANLAIEGVGPLNDLAAGQTANLISDVPAFTAASMVTTDGDGNELENDTNVEFPANTLNVVYIVGNPQIEGGDVETVVERIALDTCAVPTTTAGPTTSVSIAPTSTTAIVTVTPNFTG